MEFIDGWIIETKDGITYRLLILDGHPCGIWKALVLYRGQWYAIRTTGFAGTEREILDAVTEENAVKVEVTLDNKKDARAFRVIDKKNNVIFTDKDLRICEQRIYKM